MRVMHRNAASTKPHFLLRWRKGPSFPSLFSRRFRLPLQNGSVLFFSLRLCPIFLKYLLIGRRRDIIKNIYKNGSCGLKPQLKPSGKQILLCALFGLVAVLGIYLDAVFPLLPAVFGFVWAAWGGICCAVSIATAAAVLFACAGATQTLYALALFAPASLCIGYCLRHEKPYRTAAVGAAAALAAGYYCSLCLPSILAGEEPFAGMEATILAFADAFAEMGGQLSQAATGDTVNTAVEMLRAMSLLAPEITCAVIACLSMGFGLFDVVLARRLAYAAKVQLKPMAPFPLWQLSKHYTVLSLLLLGTALVTLLLQLSNAGAVFVFAECVVFLPLMLMGVCFMDFLTRVLRGNGALRRVLFYACIVLLFPYSTIFLVILGLVDRISKFRRRFRARKREDEDPR